MGVEIVKAGPRLGEFVRWQRGEPPCFVGLSWWMCVKQGADGGCKHLNSPRLLLGGQLVEKAPERTFSSRNFMIPGLMLKALVHFELIFLYGVR